MVLSHTLDVLSKYNFIIKSLKLEQEYNNMDENKSNQYMSNDLFKSKFTEYI